MAVYERGAGAHVAERVRPVPGSEEAERYAALAADPASGWRCAEPDPEPDQEPVVLERPSKSASKADWKAYAVQEGMGEAEADKAPRDELAAKYTDGGGD
ncbi:hypothetical protein SAMN04487981_101608 [Streptomyces sp. cf386]|uniref:hypothetical protein n=1 Tax=Streptomyces sp. cf386 TaxID=1761904 RepID=UPI00088B15EC|nr:hypothetical protein [Streptomyces sp. cf386]SDM46502.1 hypothetical protein SAMN04487981_101608 [Streptomyces sp. cf386]